MANTSIKEAFARFWEHVIARTGEMINTANEYTDAAVSNLTTYKKQITLSSSSWADNQQKVQITNAIDSNLEYLVIPTSDSSEYTDAEIEAIEETWESGYLCLNFQCANTPTSDIIVNVIISPVTVI